MRNVIRMGWWAVVPLVLGCSGGGGGGEGNPPPGGSTADTTPPTVTNTSPMDGATDVSVTRTIEARFSEPIDRATVTATSFALDGMAGHVDSSSDRATLTPGQTLEYSTTYTVRVTTSVTDTAGNLMEDDYQWSFTTVDAPAPILRFPFVRAAQWIYNVERSTLVISATGYDQSQFQGKRYVRVRRADIEWEGRVATVLDMFDLEDDPDKRPLEVNQVILSNDRTGLFRWVENRSSVGEWQRILSYQASEPFGDTFWMAGKPRGFAVTTQSTSRSTVPFGSFDTRLASFTFKQTGRYEPVDIFEELFEHYADGVGLVRSRWKSDSDDNDPRGIDVYTSGTIELTHIPSVNGGAFPNILDETEPNNSMSEALPVTEFCVVTGEVTIGDPAWLFTHPINVNPDIENNRKIQDWFRLDISATTQLRIDLRFRGSGGDDIDLYVLEHSGPFGLPAVKADSTNPGQEPESIELGGLAPGTYYIGVQAWSSPSGDLPYWISVRTEF